MSGQVDVLDGELVRRMRSDDRAEALLALDEVFRRHGRAVLSFCIHSLEHLQRAEEVVHDVFAELFAHRKALEVDGDSIRTHLVTQAHVRCTALQDARHKQADAAPAQPAPPTRRNLSTAQRLAIDLASLGRMNCAQVAVLLERPEAQVKALIHDGLSRVAKAMGNSPEQDGPAPRP